VWTGDDRYGLRDDPHGQDELFLATGGGLAFKTPVGPIEISAGYKLNPSITDLVDASDILRAAQAGVPSTTCLNTATGAGNSISRSEPATNHRVGKRGKPRNLLDRLRLSMALVPASRVPWALEGPASGSLLRWGISLVSQWLEPRSLKQHERDVQTKA
jgi:hypothetical protein